MRGLRGKPTTLAQCAWDEYTLHRHHRVRDAVVELEQRAGPRAPGSQMPGADIWRVRPNLVAGYTLSSYSVTNGKRPVGTCATSGPGTQRSRVTASTTSRLSHPVPRRLPRRAAGSRGGLLLLDVLLQLPRRKRPSPCWERALTCGN
jgi:hypothetical protein